MPKDEFEYFKAWYRRLVHSILRPENRRYHGAHTEAQNYNLPVEPYYDMYDYYRLAELLDLVVNEQLWATDGGPHTTINNRMIEIVQVLMNDVDNTEVIEAFIRKNRIEDWQPVMNEGKPHVAFLWDSGAGGDFVTYVLSKHAKKQHGFDPSAGSFSAYTSQGKWTTGQMCLIEKCDWDYEEIKDISSDLPVVWFKTHELGRRTNRFITSLMECKVIEIQCTTNAGRWEAARRYHYKTMHDPRGSQGYRKLGEQLESGATFDEVFNGQLGPPPLGTMDRPFEDPAMADLWELQIKNRNIINQWPMATHWIGADGLQITGDVDVLYHNRLKTHHPTLVVPFEDLMMRGIGKQIEQFDRMLAFLGLESDDLILRRLCGDYMDQQRNVFNPVDITW